MSITEEQQKDIASSMLRNVKIVARGTIVSAGCFCLLSFKDGKQSAEAPTL